MAGMTTASTGVQRVERRPAPQWSIGDRIRLVRRDMNMSQAEFAELLGIGAKALSAWESGYNRPGDVATLAVQLERVTGVDRMWFMGWGDPTAGTQGANSEIACSRKSPGHGLELVAWADDLADELTGELAGEASGRRHLTLVPAAPDGAGDEDADAALGAVTADLAARRSA